MGQHGARAGGDGTGGADVHGALDLTAGLEEGGSRAVLRAVLGSTDADEGGEGKARDDGLGEHVDGGEDKH